MWARGPPEPRRRCWLRAVRRRLPILGWLPRYSPGWLQLDLIAGVTVGLTVVPQALAYAEVAGLPPQYGLYSSFVGCFVYCFLGTAKDVTLGPTAIMSLLVSSYAFHDPVYAVLLTFLAGCIQLAMGLLHLGFLLDFISCPVIKGFTSAASITISFNQVKNILGLHGIPRQFFLQVYETLRRIGETRPGDAILGLVCLATLAGLRAMKSRLPPAAHTEPLATRASYLIVWTCATARNALVVLFAGLVAYCFQLRGSQPLTLTGSIPRGLPPCRLPPFSKAVPNGTVPFGTMVEDMGVGLAVVPLMGLVETVAIAKAFASQNNYRIDPNQELLAMGFANVLGSFFSSYPVTGSFGRAGPCPPLRDVPVLLLGGAVRHCGRGAGLRDPAALLHRQAPAEGVGAGHAAGAAGEQPALPSHRAPPGCHLQPRSVSTLTVLHHPGLPPHQQHRLHGGGGAGRAAAGAAQARHLAGLLQSAGPGSPSPAGCRPGRIPTFPQLGGGRAVQRSGAGRQRGSPLRQHQHQRELAAAHGAHPVRQRSRVGLSQDHVSLPEQLFPMAPEAARPVQAGQCPAVWGRDGKGGGVTWRVPIAATGSHPPSIPGWPHPGSSCLF
ncbi:sodium-independent sulfate anion transporter isoform X2 [Cygnus atratus]|uniref:sodium-independent sulfate anion transporter isoform X2 n=1 Tax=Cygnus atratus TaxID=8868 RepID=UPI0021B6FA4B|nr:sodium-independent sulfate anion transporter isoform X2 [Cygnus atratus]